jgi:hypothetical protein
MRARVKISGIRETAERIERLSRAGGEELVSGLLVIGERIATDVRLSRPGAGIPRKDGHLAGSVEVLGPEVEGGKSRVTLAAGGAAIKYGLRQHEELNWRHKLGEARYFVRGFERWMAGGNVDDAMREVMDAAVESVL